jgi:hypothetical protein
MGTTVDAVTSTISKTVAQQNRTEQLRKLVKLQCYYLDKFNQNGDFIRHKQKCKAALQLGPRSEGVLLPGMCWFLGIVQLPRSSVEHVLSFVFALVNFYARRCCFLGLLCCSSFTVARRRDSSLATRIASSQYSWDSPDVIAKSSKLHLSNNLSPFDSVSAPRESWYLISLINSSLCVEISIPVVQSWTRTHR